jgi:hypothetical protein
MTQQTYSNTTDSHEVEPRLVKQNLPPDVRHRVDQLINALTLVEQTHVPQEQPAPQPYKTPVPFDIETALQSAEAATEPKVEAAAPVTNNTTPIEQGRLVQERKMAIAPQDGSTSTLEELRRQVWNAYDDEPHIANIFFEESEAA